MAIRALLVGRAARIVRLVALASLLLGPSSARAQRTNARPIDLVVAESVCDMQIVLLGELPTHGESRAFQAKARIVEHLVNQCGFEALLFEAPVYDFLGLQESLEEGDTVPKQLDRAIGGFWLTRELSTWREWLFAQTVDGQLLIGGLDDQVSATSDYARAALPDLVAASVPGHRARECREAVERNLFWSYDVAQPFDQAEKERLQQCAGLAADALAAKTEPDAEVRQQLMAENLANLYDRQLDPASARDRDEMMSRNLRWYRKHIPAKTKIIVWTATVHAARQQGERGTKPLGTWLSDEWGDRMAVIGFSAFAGQSSMAGMPAKQIVEAPAGSLEALATATDKAWVYLDAAALRALGAVPSRLLGRFASADWSRYFDGVLVIREEVAPVFEPR